MKKLLIGGCSFSQHNGEQGWTAWTDFLRDNHKDQIEVINRAQGSFGQSRIVESLLDEIINKTNGRIEIDYCIIQWSAVGRAYSISEKEFFERLIVQYEVPFSPHRHEYMINNDKEGWVTDLTNEIEESFYRASLTQMILMKNVLENHNIPYTMFWGWEQITPRIQRKAEDLLNEIYTENFWRFGEHGGMLEWIVDKLGETESYAAKGDFHPSTKGHELFYNHIIKDILKPIL
jgi:hypothetical protein